MVLGSDGPLGALDNHGVVDVVARARAGAGWSAQECARRLVDEAVHAAGPGGGNATALIVQIGNACCKPRLAASRRVLTTSKGGSTCLSTASA
jgi:hypothetical protein